RRRRRRAGRRPRRYAAAKRRTPSVQAGTARRATRSRLPQNGDGPGAPRPAPSQRTGRRSDAEPHTSRWCRASCLTMIDDRIRESQDTPSGAGRHAKAETAADSSLTFAVASCAIRVLWRINRRVAPSGATLPRGWREPRSDDLEDAERRGHRVHREDADRDGADNEEHAERHTA